MKTKKTDDSRVRSFQFNADTVNAHWKLTLNFVAWWLLFFASFTSEFWGDFSCKKLRCSTESEETCLAKQTPDKFTVNHLHLNIPFSIYIFRVDSMCRTSTQNSVDKVVKVSCGCRRCAVKNQRGERVNHFSDSVSFRLLIFYRWKCKDKSALNEQTRGIIVQNGFIVRKQNNSNTRRFEMRDV